MLVRVIGIAFVALALSMLVSGSAATAGDKNTHEGKVVSVKGEKLTMEGKNGKEHTHQVADTAKITCDGKACKLTDLKTGLRIFVTIDNNDRATRIQAFLKENPPDPKPER
jgi:hypothetical protein